MRILCFIFSFSIFSVSLISPISAQQSSNLVDITWASGFNNAITKPVDIALNGLPLQYSITAGNSASTCLPEKSSVNEQSITLKDSTGKTYPLYTVSSSNKPTNGVFAFNLSIVIPHYELAPHSVYTLTLAGGISDTGEVIRFICTDADNNSATYYLPTNKTLLFTTHGDTIRPTILETSTMTALNRAVVYWKSSEPVTKTVRYGEDGNNLTSTVEAQQYDFWYVAVINNLKPGTTYYYDIEAKDRGGNSPASTPIRSFTTWDVSPVTLSEVTGHEVSVNWTTSVPTDSIIEYGETQNFGRRSGGNDLRNDHAIRLVNLKSNTTYYARIVLKNDKTTSTSNVFTFKTLDAGAGITAPPLTLTPGFTDQFDLSDFNFKDFPPDDLLASSSAQASDGAVLATTATGLWANLPNRFTDSIANNPWLVWLWIPIILLVGLIILVWMLWRHEQRLKKLPIRTLPKL